VRSGGEQPLPLRALSDGYRSFLAWFGDLLYRLTKARQGGERLLDLTGVALIDEIDPHLHHARQPVVVDKVARSLPSTQFIATTHSPLIAGGTYRESLRFLTRGAAGRVAVTEPSEESYGRTPDQVLLSDSFGLRQVRPAAFVKELEKEREKARAVIWPPILQPPA